MRERSAVKPVWETPEQRAHDVGCAMRFPKRQAEGAIHYIVRLAEMTRRSREAPEILDEPYKCDGPACAICPVQPVLEASCPVADLRPYVDPEFDSEAKPVASREPGLDFEDA